VQHDMRRLVPGGGGGGGGGASVGGEVVVAGWGRRTCGGHGGHGHLSARAHASGNAWKNDPTLFRSVCVRCSRIFKILKWCALQAHGALRERVRRSSTPPSLRFVS